MDLKNLIKKKKIHSKNLRSLGGATYDTAVAACTYGKFHALILITVIPASWASVLDSSNMSMVIPTAECDLNLSSFHKGILNGITYAGMHL